MIIPHITGKHVLDCGGVDHSWITDKRQRGVWLHATIAEHAETCLGIDILEDRVRLINEEGQYKFEVANVEELIYQNEFEVIVAGELIEHVYNAGKFLDSAWRSLKDEGLLILTTPNYHRLSSLLYSIVAGKEVCHEEHTCYYSKQTLTYLVERHGFAVESCDLLDRRSRGRLMGSARSLIRAIRPGLGENLIMIARKQPTQEKYGDKW